MHKIVALGAMSGKGIVSAVKWNSGCNGYNFFFESAIVGMLLFACMGTSMGIQCPS
ncbi:hypothetical protein FHW67_003393 [Herbaspirillum sp. Sphag1AN]|nr:hypothetical protein [Herbaspirillum sp. Sphag1AN]MBB3247524.1 hypothetical protein [Herbaspirillum sp. Sphag64]